MICESQKAVVDFLSTPENFGGVPIQQIDTHLSHVFLVGRRVYKIKRAIRYDFVDFSTIELRKKSCENEVSVNRRTAPEMYLGVVPIYCSEDKMGWDAKGEIVEWAVEMVRFDADQQFDALLARRALDGSTIARLADKIAKFHLGADMVSLSRAGGGVGATIDQIATSLRENDIGPARERDVARWTNIAFSEFEHSAKFLEARRRHGWVRHCHGDLHLANICMFRGKPTPFDAIEFNDDLSNIDILYDLSFALMDLIYHDRSDLANMLLNRYLGATRDYSGVRLLRLFQSMRAGVRAMVLSLPSQPDESKWLADRYFDLALEYLIGENVPRLIAIGGFSGTGKSTLARGVALHFNGRCGAVILRSDVVRKRLSGRAPEDRLRDENYSDDDARVVYRQLLKDAGRLLRAGQPVIVDATFLNPEFRRAAADVAEKAHVPFDGLWLSASHDVLIDRISGRLNDASDATVRVLKRQLENTVEPENWHAIDAGGSCRDTLDETQRVFEW